MLMHLVTTLLSQLPVEPVDGDLTKYVGDMLKFVVEQFQHRNYVPAVASIVVLVTFAVKKIAGDKIKTGQLAIVSTVVALVASLATELAGLAVNAGGFDITRAVVNGLIVGPMASGLYSLLFKQILAKKVEEVKVEAPAEPK